MDGTTFGSFAVPDIHAARDFYADTLGLDVTWADEEGGPLWVRGGEGRTLVYPKPDHEPAAFTVFNLEVPDIEAAVQELRGRGLEFLQYPGMGTDEHGISRSGDLAAAWFTDPGGNVLAVLQQGSA